MEQDVRANKMEGTSDFAFTDGIVELHGNTRFMRCPSFCNKRWFLAPSRSDISQAGGTLPICQDCGASMKPHSMCFDETYSEELYQSQTVSRYLKEKCDGLLVVGTALQTSFAKQIVNHLVLSKSLPLVEVNLEKNI